MNLDSRFPYKPRILWVLKIQSILTALRSLGQASRFPHKDPVFWGFYHSIRSWQRAQREAVPCKLPKLIGFQGFCLPVKKQVDSFVRLS